MSLIEWLSWWAWRRWRIYCPKHDVSHLFGLPNFQHTLFDYGEAFIPPCSMHPADSGDVRGKRVYQIKMLHMEVAEEREKD